MIAGKKWCRWKYLSQAGYVVSGCQRILGLSKFYPSDALMLLLKARDNSDKPIGEANVGSPFGTR